MTQPDLTIKPEDSEHFRTLKYLLTYGDHKSSCDRSNEDGPEDAQHLCCSCGWCQVADWAHLAMLFGLV